MTLTTAQHVRLRITDAPAWFDDTRYGDGTATLFTLPYVNITTASAYVPLGGTAWSATGCTVNASGFVEFSGVISANSAFRVRGVRSTFSDDEIGQFTAVGGSVAGAALEAARTLAFDSLKRASWAAPDGTTYDDTKAMDAIYKLIDELKGEIADAEVSSGAFGSWALNQEGWS